MKLLWMLVMLFPGLSACSDKVPEEIGSVTWSRDLDSALERSGSTKKPVFLLFQEVPGCAGCKQFGNEVLSDPRLVRVIENEFVPVLVRNNVGGAEAEILKRFNEPAWNYQVVRFLNAKGEDLIPRKDRVWETEALAKRMTQALAKAGRETPDELQRIVDGKPAAIAEAVFAMGCFWTGEAKLGAIEGVVTTEAGFYDRREVVRVGYNESVLSTRGLIKAATKLGCAERVYLAGVEGLDGMGLELGAFNEKGYRRAPESDQKKQLTGSIVAGLQLSPEQACKVNAWIRREPAKALSYLSAGQRAELERKR